MVKVITYGTYDLLHFGHVRLLERAKALGDYLIVGVTADNFDKARGKINVQQSLVERIDAVRATGIADEIIVEEYEGQKIDDIKRFGVDIFTVGSDWVGKFDYLKEYCKVVYLDRTEGVSSSELRAEGRQLRLGIVGDSPSLIKIANEAKYVNGLNVAAIYTVQDSLVKEFAEIEIPTVETMEQLLNSSDAVYIRSIPEKHSTLILKALEKGKHVICEAPIAVSAGEWDELISYADEKKLIVMDAVKTAYSTAFSRLLLLVQSGRIGQVISVDSTCTSLSHYRIDPHWTGFYEWGPTALLPIFQLLGTDYSNSRITAKCLNQEDISDGFIKIDFEYPQAVASLKVSNVVKSEGDLIISGTKGYVYVPAPWWKTDYFEIRYENPADNKRFFYQLDGEGIRYELATFCKIINNQLNLSSINRAVSKAICSVTEQFLATRNSL